MASIVNNPKYKIGHQVAFSEKIPDSLKKQIAQYSYKPAKSIFALSDPPASNVPFDVIQIGTVSTSDATVFMKDQANKFIKIKGSKANIEKSFIHAMSTGKSATNTLTKIKELISMWQIQAIIEKNAFLTEDQVLTKLGNLKTYYVSLYNDSAMKQAKALKAKLGTVSGYNYERQKESITKPIYEKAARLTGKAADNWNPADVWMIKKGFDVQKLIDVNTVKELNGGIGAAMQAKQIIPVSLKQVTTDKASLNLVDPNKMLAKKLDIDFGFDKLNITGSLNNFMVHTKSGFSVRGGFKTKGPSVSLEGFFQGAGYQLGGIDAKEYAKHVKSMHSYDIRGGAGDYTHSYSVTVEELKAIFAKYSNLSRTIQSLDHALEILNTGDDLDRKRKSNLISYVYSFLIASGSEKFEDHMKLCYYLAKKVTTESCSYYLLSNS